MTVSRPTRVRLGLLVVLVATLVVAAVALTANGFAAVAGKNAFPPQLVGTWTRTLTKADVKRAQVVPVEVDHARAGLVVRLIVKSNGAAELKPRGDNGPVRFQGRLVPVGTDRVHIAGMPLDVPNVYRWRVSGRLLTMAKISDRDISGLRDAWFVGVWHRA